MSKVELSVHVDEALLEQARAASIPLAAVIEEALRAALSVPSAEDFARVWAEEHAEAMRLNEGPASGQTSLGTYLRVW